MLAGAFCAWAEDDTGNVPLEVVAPELTSPSQEPSEAWSRQKKLREALRSLRAEKYMGIEPYRLTTEQRQRLREQLREQYMYPVPSK